jgi:protein-disulfide isomerase
VEESEEPRQEGSQEAPAPSEVETVEPEPGQEPLAAGELPAAEGQPEETGVPGPPTGPAFDRRRYLVPGAIAAAIVAFAAVGIFVLGMFTHSRVASTGGGGGQQVVAAQPTAGATPTPGPVDVSVDDDPSLGPADAPVTIVEFSDFQCPYCARFQSDTLPQILSNYGDRVRFVYRDFPLVSIHQYALKAAEAADCANEQGQYWPYHDLLFKNQSALDDASLKGYAASLGLDTGVFNQCLDTDKYRSEIQKDEQDGIAAGVQGTPAFAIGVSKGQLVHASLIFGAYPYPTFQAHIEAALKEAGG